MKKYFGLWCVSLLLLLISCGGGGTGGVASLNPGGVGSGGTGISVGPISGFGSIFVNGVRHNIDAATLDLVDSGALKLGMTVKVTGTTDADLLNGTASKVESAADMRGPVSALDLAASTLTVHGNVLTTDSETVYDGVTGLSALVVGDWVQVYGLPQSSGSVRATRIEKIVPGTPVISGYVSGLDVARNQFALGGLTVNYGSASFIGGFSSGALADGQIVRVRGAVAPAGGVLQATQIQVWYEAPVLADAPLALSGVVGDYASLSAFKVLGYRVDASSAVVTGGTAASLANGVKVDVVGSVKGGVLVATQLKIRQIPGVNKPASFTLLGAVGAYVSSASFKVQGQTVDASGAGVVFTGGTVANLVNGARVSITGAQVFNGVLTAQTVTFNP